MNDKNIIIVDDDKNLTKMLAFILEAEGYNVVVFNDPHLCFSYLFDNACDLVITDYRMPGMNGVELLSKIKHKYSPDTINIITCAISDIHCMISYSDNVILITIITC